METFSAIVTLYDRGESTGQWWTPLTKPSDAEFFYVLFDLHLNRWLNKHSKRRWFQTPSRSSCDDVTVMRCPTPNRRQGINNHQIRIMCMLSLNLLHFIITRCNISRASIFLEISEEILNDHLSLLSGSTILTHWGRDKMAAIFQTTFSNASSWMKMLKFRLRFHWSLFPRVQLTIFRHWFG